MDKNIILTIDEIHSIRENTGKRRKTFTSFPIPG